MLRAYDKKTGAQVGEVLMPAQISGSPMTYSIDGRQYIIVAVSGGNYTGEYIAFALPQAMARPGDASVSSPHRSQRACGVVPHALFVF